MLQTRRLRPAPQGAHFDVPLGVLLEDDMMVRRRRRMRRSRKRRRKRTGRLCTRTAVLTLELGYMLELCALHWPCCARFHMTLTTVSAGSHVHSMPPLRSE
ncbi:hypothetical protein DUNSADRAFT_1895 [Dunaliella salina]|uniref:Encoded protein n=1 Tax=Dunaliella salina TaxID=3046 RepID=A0ABQ7GWF6_DUNSA|nr:hypothetical protein DUNSADRAFT_1895 [Dunaliella salina]|eukprot:KAF5838950.1 hypothetical protein DUNSADRAFT_1895 [Dunaliella salina]